MRHIKNTLKASGLLALCMAVSSATGLLVSASYNSGHKTAMEEQAQELAQVMLVADQNSTNFEEFRKEFEGVMPKDVAKKVDQIAQDQGSADRILRNDLQNLNKSLTGLADIIRLQMDNRFRESDFDLFLKENPELKDHRSDQ